MRRIALFLREYVLMFMNPLNKALLSVAPTVEVPKALDLGAQPNEDNSNINLRQKIIDKMTYHWEKVKSHAEIRKNARVIAQASRTNTGPFFFKELPAELQIKIASFTGNPLTHNEEESEKIAYENLGKPSL